MSESGHELPFAPESGLECVDDPTFSRERRQCGGFRAFERPGANARFVP
jgi:hypothetical protein